MSISIFQTVTGEIQESKRFQQGKNNRNDQNILQPFTIDKVYGKHKMGILLSKNIESLQKANLIRQDLLNRINQRDEKYHHIFSMIEEQRKLKILCSDATKLTEMMDSFEATSVQILMCFIQRTINFGVKNNYVIDEMFEDALIMAMQCDIARKQNLGRKSWRYGMVKQQCFPPFFGVPCSVKQTILMKGRQSYGGFVSKINKIPDEETGYFTLILRMGFIPFVRSNVPQACKAFQTNNNIFGYCKNPRNQNRSCGGSSGGQGGLVGSCCSPFGIGSDIGGSLRIPAEFNGLCTIKPSLRNERDGNAFYGKYAAGCTIKGQPGPLTKSVRDLVTYCNFMFNKINYAQINQKKIDPHLNLNPFNNSLWSDKPKFKIGIVSRLDTIKCSSSHENALIKVSQILQLNGHTIVKTQLPDFEKLYFFMIVLFSCNNDMSIIDEIRHGEPLIKQYRLFEFFSKIPWIIKKVIIWLIKRKQPRLAKMMELSKPMGCKQIVELMYEIQGKKAKQIYNYFLNNQFDALVMPGFAVPAPRLGQAASLQYCVAFQSGWNVVQYPVGNLPIKLVQNNQTTYFQDQFHDSITKNMRNTIKDSEKLPIGVQIISLPKNQEKILYIMSEIEKEIKFNEKFPIKIIV